MSLLFRRILLRLVLALALLGAWAVPAHANINVSFHSFNGSVIAGRYPHTFVVFEGTLATGERVNENFGFSAKSASPAVLAGPVEHGIYIETERQIRRTNRHFTLSVSDATYRRMKQEVAAWRDAPGKYYDLETRNCIHFVGRMAELAGLKVEFPRNLLRKPKAWLNFVTSLNPQLGVRQIS